MYKSEDYPFWLLSRFRVKIIRRQLLLQYHIAPAFISDLDGYECDMDMYESASDIPKEKGMVCAVLEMVINHCA